MSICRSSASCAQIVDDRRYLHSVVKLINNWRSHPDILKFPNEEFYRGDLVPRADPMVTHSLLRWDGLATPNFPIVFHSIRGKDEREATSPSFFNADEASLVKQYLIDLFGDRRLRLSESSQLAPFLTSLIRLKCAKSESTDIGIIAPYHAQVCKIRKILPQTARDIKVGSVEEFQGQVRFWVILILGICLSDFEY